MNTKRWIVAGAGCLVLLAGFAWAVSGEFSRGDARRQLDRVLDQKDYFIIGALHLVAGSGPGIKEDLLDIAISRSTMLIEAPEPEVNRLKAELGEEGMKKFLSPFDYEQISNLRQTWASGLAEKVVFNKGVRNGLASAGVRAHLKLAAEKFCDNYQEGMNTNCRFVVARWKVDKITGVRDGIERGVPAKVVEFDVVSEPTENGRRYVAQQPTKGSFVAAFIEYDDGWRLAVGPFQR